MKDAHEAEIVQRLNEQREVLEKAQSDAVNAQKSTSFQKELKLQEKVDQLQRALDNKTAEELGEGAEIDLFELLKGEFEGDKIERINKGQPGADILHTVIHNGKECGSIIYDSKNHNAWRSEFVTKLAADQMAAKADHAVLSTRKFPAGQRHLHVHDRVILAAPRAYSRSSRSCESTSSKPTRCAGATKRASRRRLRYTTSSTPSVVAICSSESIRKRKSFSTYK